MSAKREKVVPKKKVKEVRAFGALRARRPRSQNRLLDLLAQFC
jgi:hypothetical protein